MIPSRLYERDSARVPSVMFTLGPAGGGSADLKFTSVGARRVSMYFIFSKGEDVLASLKVFNMI